MKIPFTRGGWWMALLWLGALNLGICLVFPNCGLNLMENRYVDRSVDAVASHMPPPPDIKNPLATTIDKMAREKFLRSTPLPESRWNALGFWQKIGNDPPTYVPKGYASSPPVGNSHGTWFVDPRDGKRLFAPNTAYRGQSAGAWRGDAMKITGDGRT